MFWRTGRDSNPRYGFTPHGGLAIHWFQPLTHLSTVVAKAGFDGCSVAPNAPFINVYGAGIKQVF